MPVMARSRQVAIEGRWVLPRKFSRVELIDDTYLAACTFEDASHQTRHTKDHIIPDNCEEFVTKAPTTTNRRKSKFDGESRVTTII